MISFQYAIQLVGKVRRHGVRWFLRALRNEWYFPHSSAGLRFQRLRRHLDVRLLLRKSKVSKKGAERHFIAVYDLAINPVTYDFATFLAVTEMHRETYGFYSYSIIFIPGPNDGLRDEESDYEASVPISARKWRVANLLLPLLDLAPGCRGHLMLDTRRAADRFLQQCSVPSFPEDYVVAYPTTVPHGMWLEYFSETITPRVLRATDQAKSYVDDWLEAGKFLPEKIVTITLRDYKYGQARNSNVEAWAEFARDLQKKKYIPVFIPDLENAMAFELSQEFHVFSAACWNLQLRMALYERAYVNMFINSGPAALAYFSETPYIMLKILTEEVGQANVESQIIRGYKIGEQPKFVTKGQNWVWKDDSLENISESFEDYVSRNKDKNVFG